MPIRFRKTINIAPGIRLNVSQSGISTSIGKRGATINFSKRGTRVTAGIPGSGLSATHLFKRARNEQQPPNGAKVAQLIFLVAVGVIIIKACSGRSDNLSVQAIPVITSENPKAIEPRLATQTPTVASEAAVVVQPTTQKLTFFVGPHSLNVRSSPGGVVIGSIKHGTPVEVSATKNGWGRISADDGTARWVSQAHLCTFQDCRDAPKWGRVAPPLIEPPS